MRDNKFRAWNTKTKEMTDIMFALSDKPPLVFVNTLKGGFYEGFEIIWMQYTGLKDKNGKEIYEGDVITTKDGKFQDLRVVRIPECYGWTINGDLSYRWIIVGNIYESPELIE